MFRADWQFFIHQNLSQAALDKLQNEALRCTYQKGNITDKTHSSVLVDDCSITLDDVLELKTDSERQFVIEILHFGSEHKAVEKTKTTTSLLGHRDVFDCNLVLQCFPDRLVNVRESSAVNSAKNVELMPRNGRKAFQRWA